MWKVAVNARDLPYQQALSLPLDNPNRVIDITDLLVPTALQGWDVPSPTMAWVVARV